VSTSPQLPPSIYRFSEADVASILKVFNASLSSEIQRVTVLIGFFREISQFDQAYAGIASYPEIGHCRLIPNPSKFTE
jgi:hypothetical protein